MEIRFNSLDMIAQVQLRSGDIPVALSQHNLRRAGTSGLMRKGQMFD